MSLVWPDPVLELTIYRTRGEHANLDTTDEVGIQWGEHANLDTTDEVGIQWENVL